MKMLECGIRWAVEARRREKGEQQEQWRQGEQREQSAEGRVEGWIRQGEEETGEEDGHGRREGTDGQGREREGIESENDKGKEDWGHSLERRRVDGSLWPLAAAVHLEMHPTAVFDQTLMSAEKSAHHTRHAQTQTFYLNVVDM